VLFLCSDEGARVTGLVWNVDGGTVVQHFIQRHLSIQDQ
jgi:hypothetical protein